MSLAPGIRLGAYEIVSALGAGGMGEVYRARDTKLNREVAIKVLPQEFAARPDATARFEREAQSVAALSHPNILAIHDFGSADGVSYAVMELLQGESMRQVLARGALPARRAADYAIQLARGLAAAHDKGIVHRDLKPENIFITADDQLKILDFGLARQDGPGTAAVGTLAATVNSPTEPGTVLGTVGYMAPEQVRGATVDSRADIFSFGTVLYEMVTGERAFLRETAAETMTAILREDPPEMAANRGVPISFERIIRRCLEKKPESRFRSAQDLAFSLEALSGATSARSGEVAAAARDLSSPSHTTRRPRWLVPSAALAAMVLAAAAGVWYGRQASGRLAGSRPAADPPVFQRLTFEEARIEMARFAPDGRTVVYSQEASGVRRTLLTRLEFPGATALPIDNALLMAVSPDAELAFATNQRGPQAVREGTLARVPLLGGAPRPVVDGVNFADWSPAGELAIVHVVGSQQRLEFPIGTVLFQTEGEIGWPRVSPGGEHIAFLDWPIKNDDRGTLVIIDRKGVRQAVSAPWASVRGVAWAPSGDEVWYTAAAAGTDYSIQAFGIGRQERRVLSAPAAIVLHDITKDGKVLIARYDRTIRVEASLAGDSSIRDLSWLGESFGRDISADGTRVLLSYNGRGSSADYDVYVRGSNDTAATRIGEGQAQKFSPDGKSVLTVVHGPPSRLVIHPIGTGATRTVKTGDVTVTLAGWLGKSDRLIVIGTEPGKGGRAYVTDESGIAPRAITPEGITGDTDRIAISHDGQRVVFRSPGGAMTIYPTADGPSVAANGFEPRESAIGWSSDDSMILTLTRDRPRQLVAVEPSTGKRTILRTFTLSSPTLTGPDDVIQTADGRSYVANFQDRKMTLYVVEGLK